MRLLILLLAFPLSLVARTHPGLNLDAEPVRPDLPSADLRTGVPLLDPDSVERDPVQDVRDARLIKDRLRRLYLEAKVPPSGELDAWITALQEDGSWEAFDYETLHEHFFPPFDHLKRVNGMTLAFLKESPYTADPALLDAIIRAIDFWVSRNPQTRHLWFVEIGVPLFLIKPLVLLEAELPPDLIQRAFPLLTRALRDGDYIYNGTPATGANLTWIARTALEAALLTDNVPLAQQAARRLADEIRVSPAEGIQADFGYYQHGTQFYAGGYGASFIHDAASVAALLDGTRYALPGDNLSLLVDYVLEGTRWMTRHGEWVAGSRGREIARPGGRMGATAVRRLLEVAEVPRRAELAAFAAELAAPQGSVQPTIHGNRHFWSVDLMTHHTPGWTGFIDLTSKRIFGTEGGNSENLLGYHLVDGVVQVMKNGSEYHNISPLWDWKKIPGATIRQYDGDIPFIDWWGDATRGTTSFVGGLSDGKRGMAVLDFDRHGVRVRKAWSVSDNWILAAGFGLSVESNGGVPVVTTIDQRFRRGPVLIESPSGEVKEAQDGDTALEGPVWVRHDGMGTFIPKHHRAVLRLDHRRESWERVNNGAQNPDRVEEGDLFTLWLEHGPDPDPDFHYLVWPGLPMDAPLPGPEQLPSLRFHDNGLLVVEDPNAGILQAAAFEAGRWAFGAQTLFLSAPCVLQIRKDAAGADLTVADPTALRKQLLLEIPQAWLPEILWGYYTGRHTIGLPEGEHAGNSVRVGMGVVSFVKAAAAESATRRDHLPLIDVPAGSFQRGREEGDADERPVCSVHVSAFRIGRTEVTFEHWAQVREWALDNGYQGLPAGAPAGGDPEARRAGNEPVVRVNWFAAAKWCNALSEKHGLEPVYYTDADQSSVYRGGDIHLSPAHVKWDANGYRLPTEAEWAYAVREKGAFLSGLDNVVSEWCFDFYDGYRPGFTHNPAGPDSGFLRSRRGAVKGGRAGGEQYPALRFPEAPTAGAGNIGFRVVRR